MARSLRGLGLLLLAGAVWLVLAGAVGWVGPEKVKSLARTVALAGLASLGAGITLGFMAKVSRPLTQGRCVRCGTRIERGQTYCMDHLLSTVSEAREQGRTSVPAGREAQRK